MSDYEQSAAHLAHAQRWTPGASQTASKGPGRIGPLGEYPMFAERAYGAYLIDADGRTYLDMVAGLAAIGLGYAEPRVVAAVQQAAADGGIYSLPSRLESTVAERLCEAIGQPWAEQVRWLKTGSEATEAAVRIARCATGNTDVVTVRDGYSGWHSWFQAVKQEHPGVPEELEYLIGGIAYGQDLGGISWTDVACVLLEPAPIGGGGDAAWLARLCGEARKAGALVIFDEMVWGFRLARAGGSEYFGVQPDLACYGKALGNGTPIAAVVGPRDLMQHARYVSGTFGGDTLGLAAAQEVLRIYADGSPVAAMWERGRQLQVGLREALAREVPYDLGARVSGYPVHPVLGFADDPDRLKMSLLLQRLADNGVLWHPSGVNVMACMTEADIGRAVVTVAAALDFVAGALDRADPRGALRGEPYAPAFARAEAVS